jgi:ABC-type sugar transport system permease subunit
VVTQLPFVVTLIVSFMDWNAYYPDERGFAGLTNYKRVLTDVNMRDAILTTVLLTATVVLVSLFLGMVIALLLDRKVVGRGAVRAGHRQPSLHDLPNLLPGHDYGRASAAGVIVVIGTVIIATFALRTVSSLFREETSR